MAYDTVSARFVLGNSATDALMVLSQTSTNAAPFTSRGWSGHDWTTALAIDRLAGDLWVAVGGAAGSALHRLQLISGRRLEVIDAPTESGADLVALAIARDGLYALDRSTPRIFRRVARAKTLEPYATLPPDIIPLSLTRAPDALYVSHAKGIIRIETASRRQRPLVSNGTHTLESLHSLAWNNGALYGIQQTGQDRTVVRVRLNATGNAVTRVDVLGPAAADAATLSNGVYYYLTRDDRDDPLTVRAIEAK
jgi:hypothetical protein